MAIQSSAAPATAGEESKAPESVKSVDGTGSESSEKPLVAMLEPMREEQVQNAVNFLSHPRVRGSPVIYRRSFLEKKGLTREEIDEAFRRVPDPPPDATKVEAAPANQAAQPKPSTIVQPQAPIQNQQPAASPVGTAMVPSLQQPRFHWSHALLAVGVLAASGAGTAVLFKKTVLPRLKTWIQDVIAEKSEKEKEDKSSPSLAEEAAEAAKAAASAAAIVAKTSQELLDSRNEERKYFESFMSLIDVQVKEMKSMSEVIRKLEAREHSYSENRLMKDHVQSTTGNGSTNNFWNPTHLNHLDVGPPPAFSKQVKVNGTSNTDSGAVRPSSSPASMESLTAPHPKSYMEVMSMIQRGEKPPGIKDINDMPPNPNQPPSRSLLAPRPKPWEVPPQRSSYNLQSQSSGEGFSSELPYNGSSQIYDRAHDMTDPGWTKTVKITEIEPEGEERRQLSYQTERPIQRGWVPPQPPSVVMPEAAAAIRHPKPSVQKQLSVDEQTVVQSSEVGEGVASASGSMIDVATSGGPDVDMNQTEIQEEHSNGIEVN